MEFKFCPDHECIKDKIDEIKNNKRFWHRIIGSKWFFWITTGLIVAWMGFNVWVVTEIYAQKANTVGDKKVAEVICQDIKEIKENNKDQNEQTKQDLKEIKEENKKRDEQAKKDQMEIMKMLMEIQKQVRK